MSNLRSLASTGVLVLALGSAGAVAADMENAKKKAGEVCQACHGMDGNSPIPENPKLAGQHPDYLAKALRDYKSGARKNPVMGAMASTLTAKDINDLAAYYASQPAVLISRY
jgi:cytochrome c553